VDALFGQLNSDTVAALPMQVSCHLLAGAAAHFPFSPEQFHADIGRWLSSRQFQEVRLLLAPVHMIARNHYGLLVVDLHSTSIRFGQGHAKAPIPGELLPRVRSLVASLSVTDDNGSAVCSIAARKKKSFLGLTKKVLLLLSRTFSIHTMNRFQKQFQFS
jgi:hypothetical protein